jgi:hypothetical protein
LEVFGGSAGDEDQAASLRANDDETKSSRDFRLEGAEGSPSLMAMLSTVNKVIGSCSTWRKHRGGGGGNSPLADAASFFQLLIKSGAILDAARCWVTRRRPVQNVVPFIN